MSGTKRQPSPDAQYSPQRAPPVLKKIHPLVKGVGYLLTVFMMIVGGGVLLGEATTQRLEFSPGLEVMFKTLFFVAGGVNILCWRIADE